MKHLVLFHGYIGGVLQPDILEPLAKLLILSISIALRVTEGYFLSVAEGFARTSLASGKCRISILSEFLVLIPPHPPDTWRHETDYRKSSHLCIRKTLLYLRDIRRSHAHRHAHTPNSL